jgi:hypothetical protein
MRTATSHAMAFRAEPVGGVETGVIHEIAIKTKQPPAGVGNRRFAPIRASFALVACAIVASLAGLTQWADAAGASKDEILIGLVG